MSSSTAPNSASSAPIAPVSSSFLSCYWPSIRHFVAGYFSGMSLILVGHPLDTLKVRLQTEGSSGRFRGPFHCLSETVRNEGFFGLYKGVTPPLFLTGVINAGVFGIQGVATRMIRQHRGGVEGPPTVEEAMLAAIPSGSIISLIVTPIEGVKSRLQVQYSSKSALYNGPIDCVRSILRTEGLRGLYNGWTCVAFCRLSNYAYFGSYEIFKRVFQRQNHMDGTPLSSMELIACGGFAGISYWFSCYPVDLIKARLMVAAAQRAMIPNTPAAAEIPFSVRSIYQSIYAKHGWKGFFAGFGPCLVRAFPANAAAFITYEKVMKYLPTKID